MSFVFIVSKVVLELPASLFDFIQCAYWMAECHATLLRENQPRAYSLDTLFWTQ